METPPLNQEVLTLSEEEVLKVEQAVIQLIIDHGLDPVATLDTVQDDSSDPWPSISSVSKGSDASYYTSRRIIEEAEEPYSALFEYQRTGSGPTTTTHVHPSIRLFVESRLASQRTIPDGCTSISEAAEQIEGVNEAALRKELKENPDKYAGGILHLSPNGKAPKTYVTSETLRALQNKYKDYGWPGARGAAREVGVPREKFKQLIEPYLESHPEWFRHFDGERVSTRFSPEIIEVLKQTCAQETEKRNEHATWPTQGQLAKEIGTDRRAIKNLAEPFLEEHPEWLGLKIDSQGKTITHYHPELSATLLRSVAEPPEEGWKAISAITAERSVPKSSLFRRIAEQISEEQPGWVKICRGNRGLKGGVYYSPEFADEACRRYEEEKNQPKSHLEYIEEDAKRFIIGVSRGETLEAKDFHKLIDMFGAERTVDILYQLHPEYKKLPVPYVKSTLGDYLGDYLVVRNDFSLDKLEVTANHLSNPTLKEALAEVIKSHGLQTYNKIKKKYPEIDDCQVLEGYTHYLYEETRHLENEDFDEVIEDVEEYYRSLFEDINKPHNLVDEVSENRLFPDINQRINILKLARENKLLIADDMGLGKSASAILSKETLGLRQALVVAPSNVIETWQTYLSDKRNEAGEIKGYFKAGQTPRVLTIDSLETLEEVNPADYDYILIAQERLTKDYMAGLEQLDYDMLIVDEVHKLKNISYGVRAENLIKLAEKINGDEDRYLALLSGTPVPNKVSDVAMILKLLYPRKFESVTNKELTSQILQGDILDLRSLLVPKMEMKALAESTDMPELTELTHEIELSETEKAVYEILLEEDELTATQKLQILRQFILNPEVVDATPGVSSSKAQVIGAALRKAFAEKDKIVMFVNGYVENIIRGEQTIFPELDVPNEVSISVIDGDTSKQQRAQIQDLLKTARQKMLVVVSGQTADVGVDFSGAEELFFYNDPWTEYDRRQERGRVFRPGLKNALTSHGFYAKGTVEEGIHKYIKAKYNAIEKLLHGVPLSEIERGLLKKDEETKDPKLEVNPNLAEYYFSSWDRMLKIYSYVKELGEDDFKKFLDNYGQEYADCYTDLGSRSYQANASRLSGTIIDRLARARKQAGNPLRIVDVASGPEMLKRHIGETYQDAVVSVDINPRHFDNLDSTRRQGSFLDLPIEDSSADYANLSLALHYTKLLPSKKNYERVQVFKELNRILKPGGVTVVNLMHTLDLRNKDAFEKAVGKMGFEVMERYSGEVNVGNSFRTRTITLQKVSNCTDSIDELAKQLGPELLKGLKFVKNDSVKLRDSRKVATGFIFGGKRKLTAALNQNDQAILEEEQELLGQMKALKKCYGSIKRIPREVIRESGLSRIFNGKKYVLFRRLETGPGAVVGK